MTSAEERRLKGLLKRAVAEVLEERRDLLRDALSESFEDAALVRAIQRGEKTPLTSRKKGLPAPRTRGVNTRFRESFDTDLAAITDAGLLRRIKKVIEQVEAARLFQQCC